MITGAVNGAYRLQSSDVGKTVKVRVTFTDDAGYREVLTSAATDSVAVHKSGAGAVESALAINFPSPE